ncbi:Ig-like domain-containing protein [Terriglobus roseus]|uniref:Ig-like domain-containing protein n=1 Tax=Terriglobus roseus TaxID=392734 RepID=A0A1G7ENB6_9BACT|nr:Ig-like domain-containing protein [Terriglobus roseus]SDE64875.1 Ig-like domain-containing protein [Terriglobus roseus]
MFSFRRITRCFGILAVVVSIGCIAFLIRGFLQTPRPVHVYPFAGEVGVEPTASITLAFNKAMSPTTISIATLTLRDEHGAAIPGSVSYDDAVRTAVFLPDTVLHQGITYQVTLHAGQQGILDKYGHELAQETKWSFTTGIEAPASLSQGPGGPLLLITSKSNGFSQYYSEILRNEGLNEFDEIDIEQLSASDLAKHDVAIVGEVSVDDGHAKSLADWVQGGGNLILMHPSKKLAAQFGYKNQLSGTNESVQHGGYLKIDSNKSVGAGLVRQAIQFHGDADLLVPDNANVFATLYKDAKTATQFPAVSTVSLGAGTATVFSYDLAKSIVYTRQGNPDWSGHERDGLLPIRSSDLFYGGSERDPQPDWVDPKNIAIPQADIQQRLLANLIITLNANKKPLPRFWYLPRGMKAVVVMTGDDHGHGGTSGRFRDYQRKSAKDCSLENWECIRATSHIFVGSISSEQASDFVKQGFEIGLHVYTACTDWPTKVVRGEDGVERHEVDRDFANALYSQQLEGFAMKYPGVPAPVSNRTDCITWGDYDTQPQIELNHHIRLDTNYYYWPAKWVKDKPGLFTGSGLPMRFGRRDGSLIDVYQAATQMTDESGQSYPFTVDTLLDNALGSSEYFGVFMANMHNDERRSRNADAIISSAQKHHVPVINAEQLLSWLDGRNASQFRDMKWSNNQLSFSISAGIGGNGLEAMLPMHSGARNLSSIAIDGKDAKWEKRTVAGLLYAVVRAEPGTFVVSYH